jgi:hypothetical protein
MIQGELNPHLGQESDNPIYRNSIKLKPLPIACLDNFPYPEYPWLLNVCGLWIVWWLYVYLFLDG